MTKNDVKKDKKNAYAFTHYYGSGRFLLAAKSFVLDRSKSNYKRLSITFMLACAKPFTLETGDGTRVTTHTVLIAPNVERSSIDATQSNLLIFDIPIQSMEYHDIINIFDGQSLVMPNVDQFQDVINQFDYLFTGKVEKSEVIELHKRVTATLSSSVTRTKRIDARIESVMKNLKNTPLEQITLESIAESVHLSPSRLRHLFKEELGCTFSHYARWINVWKAVELWVAGKTLTELAAAAGFYDAAHLNRAFVDVFGLNPTQVVGPEGIKLVRIS